MSLVCQPGQALCDHKRGPGRTQAVSTIPLQPRWPFEARCTTRLTHFTPPRAPRPADAGYQRRVNAPVPLPPQRRPRRQHHQPYEPYEPCERYQPQQPRHQPQQAYDRYEPHQPQPAHERYEPHHRRQTLRALPDLPAAAELSRIPAIPALLGPTVQQAARLLGRSGSWRHVEAGRQLARQHAQQQRVSGSLSKNREPKAAPSCRRRLDTTRNRPSCSQALQVMCVAAAAVRSCRVERSQVLP